MAKILHINNAGAGFAEYIEVADGTTVEKFIAQKMPGCNPADYIIRVNRLPVARDQVLQEGDRVTVTASKIEGAESRLLSAV